MKLSTFLLAVPFALGCSGSSTQTLSGRIATGFPSAITEVQVLHGATVVSSAKVAADGSFVLSVAPSTGLQLRAIGSGQTALVFPRSSGTIARTFSIRGAGVPFDLGALHYVGSASTTTFAFHDAGSASTCDSNDHDSTGATCVDDGDTSDGACGSDQEAEGSDSGSDASADTGAPAADDGDAVAEHNFPADGCADGNDNGGDDAGSGSGS